MTPPSFQLFGTPHIVAMAVMVAVPAALSVTGGASTRSV